MSPELWSTSRVAGALDCNIKEVQKLIRQKRLRAKRFGRTYRVGPAAVADFIDQMETA